MMAAMPNEEALGRIADAAERIADALDHMVRLSLAAGPTPRLAVRRAPADTSAWPPVTLAQDGRLMVNVLNETELATTLSEPTASFGEAHFSGGTIGRDHQAHASFEIAGGAAATVVFELRDGSYLLKDVPLVLRLPYSPGRFPPGSVLTVELEPAGDVDGRSCWRVEKAREVAADAAA